MGLFRQVKAFLGELRALGAVVDRFAESIEHGTFDYEQPRTELKARLHEAAVAASQVDFTRLEPLLRAGAAFLSRPAVVRRIRGAFGELQAESRPLDLAASALAPSTPADEPALEDDPRVRLALARLEEMHAQVPYATLAILAHMVTTAGSLPWDLARWAHLRKRAQTTRGERRAWALKELAHHVTENLHQRHVRALDFAERLATGRPGPDARQSYGSRLGFLAKDGAVLTRQLASPDAAMVRNASSHLERWHPDEDTDTVMLQDGLTTPVERRFTYDELFDFCEGLGQETVAFMVAVAAHTLQLTAGLIAETRLLELILGAMGGRPLAAADEEAEGQALRARFLPLLTRLEQMGLRPRRAVGPG